MKVLCYYTDDIKYLYENVKEVQMNEKGEYSWLDGGFVPYEGWQTLLLPDDADTETMSYEELELIQLDPATTLKKSKVAELQDTVAMLIQEIEKLKNPN